MPFNFWSQQQEHRTTTRTALDGTPFRFPEKTHDQYTTANSINGLQTTAMREPQHTLAQSPPVRQALDQSPSATPSEPPPSPTAPTPVPASSPVAKSWAHFVAGGVGGMTAATLTSPLDVLKTRLQSDFYRSQISQNAVTSSETLRSTAPIGYVRRITHLPVQGLRHFGETFSILAQIYKTEGPRALFKGLGPNLVGVVPARAINFWAYGNGKRVIATQFNDGKESGWVHLLAAASAGIITGTATNPIWVIKTRLQLDRNQAEKVVKDSRSSAVSVQATRRYKNSIDCTVKTFRQEGFRGLYTGLSASYLGVSESTLQWVLYERMKLYLRERSARIVAEGREPTSWDQVVDWGGRVGSAGLAKCFAAALTYPHEVVRTRLRQAPEEGGLKKYTGLVQCFKTVWRDEGMAGLYGGLTPHLLRVVPSAAIMFGMYEVILRGFGVDSNL